MIVHILAYVYVLRLRTVIFYMFIKTMTIERKKEVIHKRKNDYLVLLSGW